MCLNDYREWYERLSKKRSTKSEWKEYLDSFKQYQDEHKDDEEMKNFPAFGPMTEGAAMLYEYAKEEW